MNKLFLSIPLLFIAMSAEEMPIYAKPGQCFTKAFFPPKELQTVKTATTKRVVLRKSSIEHKVVPAQYKWIEKRVKVSDGIERIVTTPAVYKTVHSKVLIEPAKRVWRRGFSPNAKEAFNSCVESASNAGMNLAEAKSGTCFYEHYIPSQYVSTTTKILASEASTRVVTTPAKYKTYTQKIVTDSTAVKLVPVSAKYKKVKEDVVIAPARSEWKKATCQDRGCNQSEVVCLIEVPRTTKTVTKKVLLEPSVAKKVAIEPKYEYVKVRKMVEPAKERVVQIPAKYQMLKRKRKIANAKYLWSTHSTKNAPKGMKKQCDKICLVETPARYKTLSKRVVVTPASSKKVITPPQYKMVKVKKILKPAYFKKITLPTEYEIVTVEKERTKGVAKWMPVVCQSNMTSTTVKKIQEALKREGFYSGAINGIWNAESKLATKAYQHANGLTVTRLSIETMKRLGIY